MAKLKFQPDVQLRSELLFLLPYTGFINFAPLPLLSASPSSNSALTAPSFLCNSVRTGARSAKGHPRPQVAQLRLARHTRIDSK